MNLQVGSTNFTLNQPTSTVIVYFLGLLTIGVGLYFLRIRDNHKSRLWWGIGLLLWGVGALLAGTSYQAFGYEIKCAGRAYCKWTSWWEVLYLLVSVAAMNAILIGEAFSCAREKWRKALSIYAIISVAVYIVIALIGAFVPVKFLISFELLIVFSVPNALIFLILNGWRYYKLRESMDLALLGSWAWLNITIGAYYSYYVMGLTQKLWAKNIWFSENDILHIGMIVFIAYIALVLAKRIKDLPVR